MNDENIANILAATEKENEELRYRNAELLDFIEHGTVPLHRVNAAGIIIWANQAELDLLGYRKEEYVGLPVAHFHQDLDVLEELMQRLANKETVSGYPAKLKCKDGSIKYVTISANALFEKETFIQARCYTKDITGLVQEQERKNKLLLLLEESEERLRLAIGAIDLGTWDWDMEAGKIYLSAETRHILDLEDHILVHDHILGMVHPEDRKEVNLKIDKLKHDFSDRNFEFICRIIKYKQKTTAWIKIQGSTYFDPTLGLQRIIGSILDITELKVAEIKNAHLVAIVNSSNDAIVGKSLVGIITSWNNAAEELFGFSADEMIGQSIIKLIPENLKSEEEDILTRLKNGESLKHFETKRLTKSGRILDVSLTISPILNDRGAIFGISKIARDISEKKIEERRKNDFISMVSHELKTPLTSILLFTQLLQRKYRDIGDHSAQQMNIKIENQAKKMTALIRDFLSLARIEEGKLQVQMEPFSLRTLLEEIKNDAEHLISKHTIIILCDQQITLVADRDKIGQVFTNLVSNAIKYSPQGGTITVGCIEQGDRIKLSVQDQGIGIDIADQKKLFHRFYRVDNEQTNHISGFGIGLYIVSEILTYHHSKIEVSSQKGVGTEFYFLLQNANGNGPAHLPTNLAIA